MSSDDDPETDSDDETPRPAAAVRDDSVQVVDQSNASALTISSSRDSRTDQHTVFDSFIDHDEDSRNTSLQSNDDDYLTASEAEEVSDVESDGSPAVGRGRGRGRGGPGQAVQGGARARPDLDQESFRHIGRDGLMKLTHFI